MTSSPAARVAAGVPTGGQFAAQSKAEASLSLASGASETDRLRAVYDSLTPAQQSYLTTARRDGASTGTGAYDVHPSTADGLARRGLVRVWDHGNFRRVEMTDHGQRVAATIPGTAEHTRAQSARATEELNTAVGDMDDLFRGAPTQYEIWSDDEDAYSGALALSDGTEVGYESESYDEVEAVMRAETFLDDPDAFPRAMDGHFASAYRLSARRHNADSSRLHYLGEDAAAAESARLATDLETAAADYYDCDTCGLLTLHEADGSCTSC